MGGQVTRWRKGIDWPATTGQQTDATAAEVCSPVAQFMMVWQRYSLQRMGVHHRGWTHMHRARHMLGVEAGSSFQASNR